MRTIDKAKIRTRQAAVLDFVDKIGIANFITAKVVKTAGVSPALYAPTIKTKQACLVVSTKMWKSNFTQEMILISAKIRISLNKYCGSFFITQLIHLSNLSKNVQTLWNNPEQLDEHTCTNEDKVDTITPIALLLREPNSTDRFDHKGNSTLIAIIFILKKLNGHLL